jgi:hypothetical protein
MPEDWWIVNLEREEKSPAGKNPSRNEFPGYLLQSDPAGRCVIANAKWGQDRVVCPDLWCRREACITIRPNWDTTQDRLDVEELTRSASEELRCNFLVRAAG